MVVFLEVAALMVFVVTVTALPIAGVIHLTIAQENNSFAKPSAICRRRGTITSPPDASSRRRRSPRRTEDYGSRRG